MPAVQELRTAVAMPRASRTRVRATTRVLAISLTHHVLERFPERRSDIASLLERNAEFGSLCEDYGEAVEALRRWQASPGDHASLEVRHFELLPPVAFERRASGVE